MNENYGGPKKHTGLIAACIVVWVFALAAVGIVAFLYVRSNKKTEIAKESTQTAVSGSEEAGSEEEQQPAAVSAVSRNLKPLLMQVTDAEEEQPVQAMIPRYTVAPDLSNVTRAYYLRLNENETEKLKENQFAVSEGQAGSEFHEIYEQNRYDNIPSFVTVDSLMHTYHLYFSHLMKNTEKDHLAGELAALSTEMTGISTAQYNELRGTAWENAALRNVAFFTVGALLQGQPVSVLPEVQGIVENELALIGEAGGIVPSPLMEYEEDYSQYKPRGYYAGDEVLEAYFRAMMWYGRIAFKNTEEDQVRSALLISAGMGDNAADRWTGIYAVTSFFCGASDDPGFCEYRQALTDIYGEVPATGTIAKEEDKWQRFYACCRDEMKIPLINSLPVEDDGTETDKAKEAAGFRFMGQRTTLDGVIFQNLIHARVKDRMLPDVLDVPAALGSATAHELLQEQGDTSFENYEENLNKLKVAAGSASGDFWNASLYTAWLNTLRPLFTEKGEGYPVFMQSKEWSKKALETFAGSFTELKHDTVLYAKQAYAEMGDDPMAYEIDDRGYVEPEPLVYQRFAAISQKTAEGLDSLGMLSAKDAENLRKLEQLAVSLRTISEKELRNEVLTAEEYELIRCYGGELEHFWFDVMSSDTGEEMPRTGDYPAALVTDIATDPNGSVLEIGTGNPALMTVIIMVDGELKFARGSVYSFYQFAYPLGNRLTDSEWRQMQGLEVDGSGYYNRDNCVDRPWWTKSYRWSYGW